MLIFNASGYPDERVASFPQKAERGHVFTDKNYYLCTDIDKDGNFNIQLELPIEGNEDFIDEIRRNGKEKNFLAIPVTESTARIIDEVGSRGGRVSWEYADFERLRSGAGGDASVSRIQEADSRGN